MTPVQLEQLFAEGEAFQAEGRLDQAVERFSAIFQAVAARIGRIRVDQSYWDFALPFLELAAGDSNDLEMQLLLARAYRLHRRYKEAMTPLKRALGGWSRDERAEVLSRALVFESLCTVCTEIQNEPSGAEEAIALYQLGLEALPNDETILFGLGRVLLQSGRVSEALVLFERLVNLNPVQIPALFMNALCCIAMGDDASAIRVLGQVLQLQPENNAALRILMEKKGVSCDWTDLEQLRNKVREILDKDPRPSVITLVVMQTNFDDAGRQLAWTRKLILSDLDIGNNLPYRPDPKTRTRRRIRVGYFSPHFNENPVAFLTAGLYSCHNREDFEVFIYSYGQDDCHPIRQRIKNAAEHFVDLVGEPAEKIAERIYHDEVDILVDLSGSLAPAKPMVMAFRPAPIQIIWLGYVGTMGAAVYDYIIADDFSIPINSDQFYSEKVVRMPHTFQIADNGRAVERLGVTRRQYGLPDKAFVFSNCGMPFKIQPEQFDLWIEIIRNVPNSVLWLLKGNSSAEVNLREKWRIAGLAQERLIISPRVSAEEHVERISLADLFIDTYPCGSGATANDVLWAGLPLLALAGTTMVSRMAGSLLHAIGLPELIANNAQEYRDKAIYYGTHPVELGSIRMRLQANKSTWPLFDTKRFVRNLESGYRQMAARARAGLPPAAITVMEEQR